MEDALLDGLNAAQREAVTHGKGPLLIIAGAGTGKTSVITKRIAWLIREGLAKPEQILALTFTDKAAGEMEERVDQLLPYGYTDTWIMTFHAFAEKILREFASDIGLSGDFFVLDETETCLTIRRHFDRFAFEYFKVSGNPARHISDLYDHFSRLKDEGITPAHYAAFVAQLRQNNSIEQPVTPEELAKLTDLANAFAVYEAILKEEACLDFGGLMLELHSLLTHRPHVRAQIAARFSYVLVDEFQDTNALQYKIVQMLLTPEQNLTVVGDDDQAIYKFRGASLANLLSFVDDMPHARRIVLIDNYRSRQQILDAAHSFIQANNPHRLEAKLSGSGAISKKLKASHEEHIGQHGVVEELVFEKEKDEAQGVVGKILALKADDPALSWRDFAILVRANNSAGPFVQALERAGIPFRFYGLQGLYTSPLIIDMLCLARVSVNAFDGQALARVLAHAAWKLPDLDYMRLLHAAHEKGKPLFDIVQAHAQILELSAEAHTALDLLLKAQESAAAAARTLRPTEAFLHIIHAFDFLKHLNSYKDDVKKEAMGLLTELYGRLKRYDERAREPSLANFLQHVTDEMDLGDTGQRAPDPEAGPDVVKIMTVHASKGLEFAYVFISHMVDQRFPAQNRSRGIPVPEALLRTDVKYAEHAEAMNHLSEERRLLYVAITRGKRGVYFTRARDYGGERKKKPSRFLLDMGFAAHEPVDAGKKSKEEELKLVTRAPSQGITAAHSPKKLSFTQIAAFMSCPMQYKFAHILRVPIIGRASKSFGTTMHNVLEEALQQPTLPSVDELFVLLDKHWVNDWYANDDERDVARVKARNTLRIFHEVTQKEQPRVAFLEQDFTVKIAGIPVKGRIDRIDKLGDPDRLEDGYEIIDYKTGNPKTQEDIEGKWENRRQLALYLLAAAEVLHIPIKRLTLWYLEDGSRVSFEPHEKDVERLKKEIEEVVAGINSSDFSPTPGFMCRFCDFRDICDFAER